MTYNVQLKPKAIKRYGDRKKKSLNEGVKKSATYYKINNNNHKKT